MRRDQAGRARMGRRKLPAVAVALLAAVLPSCSAFETDVATCERTVTVSLNPGGGDSIAICWAGPAARQHDFATAVAEGFDLPAEWVEPAYEGGLVIQLADRLGHFQGDRYRFDFDSRRLQAALGEAGYGDFNLIFCPLSQVPSTLDSDPQPLNAPDDCMGWRLSEPQPLRFSYVVEPSVRPYLVFLAVLATVTLAFIAVVGVAAGGRRSSAQRHRRGAIALWVAAPLVVLGGWMASVSATPQLTLRYRLSPLADGLGGLPPSVLAAVLMVLTGFVLWKPKPPPLPPAAWYPDPAGTGMLRYWDGSRWTTATAPAHGYSQDLVP